ncbi:hypothetical protein PT7_0901 [Pusillimonas sp. T7-7]|nr:hypothetical protein PT7_0901 [Pusillimonas sp. T7-7]
MRFNDWISWQPVGRASFSRCIDEDGERIRDDGAIIIEHWNFAESVKCEKFWLPVATSRQIDLNQFVGNTRD